MLPIKKVFIIGEIRIGINGMNIVVFKLKIDEFGSKSVLNFLIYYWIEYII